MTNKTFSISEAAGYGVRTTFKHFGFFVLTLLFTAVVWGAFFFTVRLLFTMSIGLETLRMTPDVLWQKIQLNPRIVVQLLSISFLYSILQMIGFRLFELGFNFISFDIHDKGKSRVMRIFAGFRVLHKDIGATILIFFIVLALVISSLAIGGIIGWIIAPQVGAVVGIIFGIVGMIYVIYLLFRFSFYSLFIVDKGAGSIASLKDSYALTRGLWWKTVGLQIVAGLLMITIILWPAGHLMRVAVYRKIVS